MSVGALIFVFRRTQGVKTAESDAEVDAAFVTDHLRIGLNSLKQLINEGLTIRPLNF